MRNGGDEESTMGTRDGTSVVVYEGAWDVKANGELDEN